VLSPEHAVELGEAMIQWGSPTESIQLGHAELVAADACTPGCLYVGGKLIACGACDGGR
jgi:hypothetical protein